MKLILPSIILIMMFFINIQAKSNEFYNTSLGADIGSTGFGITVVTKLKEYEKWAIRIASHKLNTNYTTTDDTADYDFDVKLGDIQLMADYHPWNTSFKYTFGALYNNTKFDGKITPNGGNYTFNKHTYSTSEIGRVDTHVEFSNTIAPYIGIGWDTSFYKPDNSWGFSFNLGIIYSGSAKVSYSPAFGSMVADDMKKQIENDLEVQKSSLQDTLDKYKIMPYVSIGFNYKF